MLQGLNHLTLAVSDLASSLAFYQQLPGMRLHASWDSGAYLSCGALWLCLSLDEQRRKTPLRKATIPTTPSAWRKKSLPGWWLCWRRRGLRYGKITAVKGRLTIFSTLTAISWSCMWGIWRSGWPPVANAPTRGWSFLIDGLVQLTAGFQRADPQR